VLLASWVHPSGALHPGSDDDPVVEPSHSPASGTVNLKRPMQHQIRLNPRQIERFRDDHQAGLPTEQLAPSLPDQPQHRD
jgi:hypothetical protein